MYAAALTFVADVAKWLCHSSVSFSWMGCSTAALRLSHHADSPAICSDNCWLYCLRAAAVAFFPGGGPGGANDGIGVATAPGSAAWSLPRARPTCADQSSPAPVAAGGPGGAHRAARGGRRGALPLRRLSSHCYRRFPAQFTIRL